MRPRVELAAFPQPGKLTYAIMRDGDQIGTQVDRRSSATAIP